MLKNITEYEIPLLPKDFNLTDGHAYREWSPQEEKIITNANVFLKSSTRQRLPDVEKEYITRFLTLGKQTIDFAAHTYLQCTTASLGLEIIANYLRLNNLTLSLIEPCFDNLADIFKRHTIPLTSFPDEYLERKDFAVFLETVDTDAICLVTPNNPTGNALTKKNFLLLLDFCKRNQTLLILDCCFRAYLPQASVFDQYGLLKDAGISYLILEDTGKTWPTVELKAPFLVVSNDIYQQIYDIYTDMLLHVSPFIITLMTAFINHSINDNLHSVHEVVKTNRNTLYKAIQGTILTPVEKPYMSMAWLAVKEKTGFQVKQMLDENGVHILPGDFFYWSDHSKGKYFVRIALVRTPRVFAEAAKILGNIYKS